MRDEIGGYETLQVHVDEGVAVVTLNRPDVLNAFNTAMRADFARLWEAVKATASIRAVVLRAAGTRAFSTGLDVTEHAGEGGNPWVDETDPWRESEDPGHQLSPKRNGVWKPVIAAVQGMCAGGAFYWIAECDIVICSPEATFFDPHVTYGMVAALEPIQLTYRMHFSDALRMALMGLHERITAARALTAGLVTEIVSLDELWARAGEIAAAVASQPPAAVQGTVKAIWQSLDRSRSQALGTALLYTQVGNPLGTAALDRATAKPQGWRPR
jgi:enoyl-CoA hydratase/carnithine racemase